MTLADRLRAVQDQIAAAALACGRAPEGVRLIAVSKTRPAEDIAAAHALGQVDFGENYAQELRDKADALGHTPLTPGAPSWHFIGALQKNKVRLVVGRAGWIHDVDSLALAQEISRRAVSTPPPAPVRLLLGVNIGREPQKSGLLPEQALDVAAAVAQLPGVSLQGLMCIPPAVEDPAAARPFFTALAALAEAGQRQGLPLRELSMGMSHDFAEAIACGATMVRVGTAIFGARAPKPLSSEG